MTKKAVIVVIMIGYGERYISNQIATYTPDRFMQASSAVSVHLRLPILSEIKPPLVGQLRS